MAETVYLARIPMCAVMVTISKEDDGWSSRLGFWSRHTGAETLGEHRRQSRTEALEFAREKAIAWFSDMIPNCSLKSRKEAEDVLIRLKAYQPV